MKPVDYASILKWVTETLKTNNSNRNYWLIVKKMNKQTKVKFLDITLVGKKHQPLYPKEDANIYFTKCVKIYCREKIDPNNLDYTVKNIVTKYRQIAINEDFKK